MNGTTMLRPAGSEPLYLPKRSTMPARACGTIRTVFASTTTTNSNNSSSRTRTAVICSSFPRTEDPSLLRETGLVAPNPSGVEARNRMDVGGGALDLQHFDGLARFDHESLVVGAGGPLLAGEFD